MPRIAVWSKLFHAEYWKENRFPEGEIHEDYLLTCKAYYEAEKICLIKEGLYNHLIDNPTSIMNTKFGRRDLYKEKQYKYRIEYLESKKDKDLVELAKLNYYVLLLELYWKCAENNMPEQDEIWKIMYENKEKILASELPLKKIWEYRIIFFSKKIYIKLRILHSKRRKYAQQ